MPTASKLAAALFFAGLAWFAADLVKPLLPEGTPTGQLNRIMAVIGASSGWKISGTRAGQGLRAGFGYGLTTSAVITFWGVLIFSGYKMLQYSLNRRFDGPVEALQAMAGYAVDYVVLIAVPSVVGALVVGGLFGGWLVEWVARRWS